MAIGGGLHSALIDPSCVGGDRVRDNGVGTGPEGPCAVDKLGLHASYATTGSVLFLTALGGDLDFVSNNIVPKAEGGCQDIGGGSSLRAPVVSRVIALMLEVNPNLGWRDVQAILAETSQQTDPTDSSWVINGA